MNKLQAFHGDKEFKRQMVGLAIKHRKADEFIKGTYGEENVEGFRACSVGCTINDLNQTQGISHNLSDHAYLAEQLGVPEWLCRLQDSIFEGLPDPKHAEWTERLYKSIPCGADLSLVLLKFLLKTQNLALKSIDKKEFPDIYKAVLGAKDVLERWVANGLPDWSTAWSARSAAESAWSAAWEQMADDLIAVIAECSDEA